MATRHCLHEKGQTIKPFKYNLYVLIIPTIILFYKYPNTKELNMLVKLPLLLLIRHIYNNPFK
ncbi:hypothetical protein OPHB3_3357 [Oceanobacillus picturae]|uniref:Uncharacterized protein n=1 Tax=Oceanobacillus picturae TaxID=171693 RepID=A0A0U9I1K3_9BACI|nr:hypothetical protein OPHB3_3357 [Oceanobacillus picturae]